jgi:hypothetical protein
VGVLYKFQDSLKKYLVPETQQLLFDPIRSEIPTIRVLDPTRGPTSWTLNLELNRSEMK